MKSSAAGRWDWPSSILLVLMLQVAAARLVVTHWTDFLYFAQTLAVAGVFLGLALGYSHFKRRIVTLLVIGYSIVLIPWQLTLAIDDILLSERLSSVGGRLYFSAIEFFQREPVQDSLLFVAFISIVIWFISLVSGYWWSRHENYLVAVLPGGIFTLVIHLYDQVFSKRVWFVAIYLLFAMLLLGLLYYVKNRESWQERRVFQMQESTFDLTRGMVVAAALFIFVAWTVPASQAGVDSAVQTWRKLTKPWRDMQEWLSNAVEPLEGPRSREAGDLYGSQLSLGLGNPLSEAVEFRVEASELLERQARFYWRGYVYDTYQSSRWSDSESETEDFSPSDEQLNIPDSGRRSVVRLTVITERRQFLLYIATQPVWVSRPGTIKFAPAGDNEQDLFAWMVDSSLSPGEQYQIRAMVADPSIQDLQAAGTEYPQWVTDRYLQLPENFSPRIRALASEITQGTETPFDKATVITSYLRREIEYVNPLPEAIPEGVDPLEWVLFDSKQGFCNYYATAEVLMLRSLGIPARMAVGFAEGEFDPETFVYTVQSRDAHAWPEVFFPGIGWIEFEPTGNQAPLVRPDRPEEDTQGNDETDSELATPQASDLPNPNEGVIPFNPLSPIDETNTISPFLYLSTAIFLLVLLWFLNRQYAVIDQIPARLQIVYERNGGSPPAWINNWAHWNALSPIERSFETINRSLRLLSAPPALYHTPTERADALIRELPKATNAIEILAEQHLKSLFTPHPGDAGTARRASMRIWLYTIQSLIQNLINGPDH